DRARRADPLSGATEPSEEVRRLTDGGRRLGEGSLAWASVRECHQSLLRQIAVRDEAEAVANQEGRAEQHRDEYGRDCCVLRRGAWALPQPKARRSCDSCGDGTAQ